MKQGTEQIIMAAFANDETISKADMMAALDLLNGKRRPQAVAAAHDYPLTRAEAAAALRVSRATITTWAKRGTIRRIAIAGRKKAVGYSRADVYAILNGETTGNGNEVRNGEA